MSKSIAVRVDEDLKKQAEATLEEIGLNMTTYIISSLKALVREQEIPFQMKTEKCDYIQMLNQSIFELENGDVVKYSQEQRKAMED